MARETSQTFDRGLQLLELLARPTTPLASPTWPRPSASRGRRLPPSGALEDTQVGGGRRGPGAAPGSRLARLTGRVVPALRSGGRAPPAGWPTRSARAHLTIAEGDDGIAIVVVEPSATSVHVAYRTGSRHPRPERRPGILGSSERPRRWYVTSGSWSQAPPASCAPRTRRGRSLRRCGLPRHDRRADHRPSGGAAAGAIRSARVLPAPSVHVRGSGTPASPPRT
jgi:hypothetical protein